MSTDGDHHDRHGCPGNAAFDPSAEVDPTAALARIDVQLRVHPDPLRLPGKVVYGAWDPLLRRIDLYGCDDSRSDLEIMLSFGHELYHAIADEPGDTCIAETQADQFAEAWCARLGPAGVTAWSQALRRLRSDPSTSDDDANRVRR